VGSSPRLSEGAGSAGLSRHNYVIIGAMLAIGFFVIALIYSAVGFGGGSTYIALLALSDYPAEVVPLIALPCNIAVVSVGSYLAVHRRDFDWRLSVPFFVASVPMAFVGGLIPLDATVYFLLLGLSLAIAGVSLIVRTAPDGATTLGARGWGLASVIGGGLGLLSGMVGIGGGIFLAPILHHLRWASSKTIAALCSFFILINSLSGLAGQTLKTGTDSAISGLYEAIPLLIAVVLGGVVGGRFVIEGVANQRVAQLTGLLVLLVGLRILWAWSSYLYV
jgi:uncharacterized membrane protein YfcA